ncbi:MAG: exosortase Q [Saezia sp.]
MTKSHPLETLLAKAFATLFRPNFAWCWLMAQVLALWPTWVWMSKRMADGSDDPLGILALSILGLTLWQLRHQLRAMPRLPYLLLGLGLTLIATIMLGKLPALVIGVISMLAITTTLLAVLPACIAKIPLLGLAILALPILSSLQFYAGYPLRIITAEVSSWILMLFYEVSREGSTLLVDGKLIIVDAPCSGVQMAWLGYFTACTVALWQGLSDRQFLLRLPFVGMLVLIGNIVRNSVLVALQAGKTTPAEWLHQGIGLVALGAVCVAIAGLILKAKTLPDASHQKTTAMPIKHHLPTRTFLYTGIMFFMLCSIWSMHQAHAKTVATESQKPFIEWPYEWQGTPLRPLALSDIEIRFNDNFPGAITRMTDGYRNFVFRHVTEPTRKLHPAADCYLGLGYSIRNEILQHDANGLMWRCFIATRAGKSIQVCEHIEDMQGQSYTDTSAWYWSALMNPSAGPWVAITIAQTIHNDKDMLTITE